MGAFVLTWEFITAIMGELLEIDAYDQPGVELGKKIAHGLWGTPSTPSWLRDRMGAGGWLLRRWPPRPPGMGISGP